MAYRLHGSPLSPYMRAAQIVFHEHGIGYDLIPVGPADLQAPDYGDLHPYRKLPALDAAGHRIFETSAIMCFADDLAEPEARLQPTDPLERARSNQWLSAANSYVYRDAFTRFYFQRALAPRFDLPVSEEEIADGIGQTAKHLGHVEQAIEAGELGHSKRPTLGDVLMGCVLILIRDIEEGRTLLDSRPRTADWLESLVARPSFASTGT